MYIPFVLSLLVCGQHSVSESEDSVAWVPEICAIYVYIIFVADYYGSAIIAI